MSATGGKEKWLEQWTTHPRSVTLLLNWDSRRGVLLASHDESADETIPKVVELISPDYTVEVYPSFSNTQWEEAVAILSKKQIQRDIFSGPLPKRVCLIIRALHKCPEWMLNRLQGLFERSPRPFNCVASTNQLGQIDRQYRSFFDEWHKIGRPRHRGHKR